MTSRAPTRTLAAALIAVAWLVGRPSARLTALAAVQSTATRHATVALLSDSASLPSSGAVLLGVHFTMEKGWHIYWRNPGGSGSPPAVSWRAPAGLSIGELQWAVPQRLTSQGVTEYGYERATMLLASVRRAPSAPLGKEVTVAAAVEYVICGDICVKESASPSITLNLATSPRPSISADEFNHARAELPREMPPGWHALAAALKDGFALSVDTGRPETAATFFPLDQGVLDDAAPQPVQALPRGLKLELKKSPFFLRLPSALRGVLVLTGAGAYVVDAPLVK